MSGMMALCTAVGRANPSLRHVCTRGGQRPRSANVVVTEEADGSDDGSIGLAAVLCAGTAASPISPFSSTDGRFRLMFFFEKRLDMMLLMCGVEKAVWSHVVGTMPERRASGCRLGGNKRRNHYFSLAPKLDGAKKAKE